MIKGMAKKYKEIRIIKNNSADRDLTFTEDNNIKLLQDEYYNKSQDRSNSAEDDHQRLVKMARFDIHQHKRGHSRNKSKAAVSKQNHSPVYE
jgi:hypothetical protein